jgi:nicotinate dehydrogenase subunit A
VKIRVNGKEHEVAADESAPLLYALRNDLKLKGTRFGCGVGQCGSCTVLLDGNAVQSCDTPLWAAAGHEITTIEGLGGGKLHPLQQAFIEEQAAQCGYCINGIIMSAAAFLKKKKDFSDEELRAALGRHLCRCGTHVRILRAIRKVAGKASTEPST